VSEHVLKNSEALYDRARRVIPGGLYGHQARGLLTRGSHPVFLESASGCRLKDVDGNEYIDFLCAYGPMVVGYGNESVERAAALQREACDTMNVPAPAMVELAEKLVGLTPGADWVLFAKNGSDVTTWSLAVARAATGRDNVAVVAGTYHGVHGWCNQLEKGFPGSERSTVVNFDWNDLDSLDRCLAVEGGLAAVMVTPFRHEAFSDSQLPADGFLEGVRQRCSKHGAVMIVDDVRAGFRLHLGGSSQLWGVTPDLLLYSKALANGYPLSAMLGVDSLRSAAREVFYTGTFGTQAVPLAAAVATLDFLEDRDGPSVMREQGESLCSGLREQAQAAGFGVTISGPAAIPFMTFTDDSEFALSRRFAGLCADGGVFIHPLHNWFLSTAHSAEDIEQALSITTDAFSRLAQEREG